MTKIQKRLNALVTVVMILSALLCVYVCVQLVMGREASILGFRLYRIQTGSMEPTISIGSIIVVHETDPLKLRTGDIITFTSKDSAIYGEANTHRIIATETDDSGELRFVTQGDANPVADSVRVAPSDIKGKVVLRMSSSVSLFFGFLHTKMGFTLVIILPLMLIIWLFMRDFRRQVNEFSRSQAIEELEKERRERGETTSEVKEELESGPEERGDNLCGGENRDK